MGYVLPTSMDLIKEKGFTLPPPIFFKLKKEEADDIQLKL